MKPIITTFLVLATSLVAQARLIKHWTDQELFEKSDLVLIATPTTSSDTLERIDLPGLTAQKVIGVETAFAVSAIVKGDKEMKDFILHHYRADEERTGIVANGPRMIAFKPEEKRKFLLYLIKEADGRYAPTVGQVDPGMKGITALNEPVSGNTNSASPADVAKPTPPPPPSVSADGQKATIYLHFFTSGIGESRQHLKTLTTKIVMGEDFDVRVDDGLESISGRLEKKDGKIAAHFRSHYASCSYNYDGIIEMEKKYDAGNGTAAMSSILYISTFVVSTHADSKLFAAIQAEQTDFQKQMNVVTTAATSAKLSVSPEAQAVLDGLNQKAADQAWQSAIDTIERPETRTPNTVDSGEVTAFLSASKREMAKLGVRIAWNATSKRYEVIAEVKTVDLGRVEMVDGSPSTFDLGGGRSCTITPTIGFSAVNSYDLVLQDGAAKMSAPRQTAVVGQPVHISVGQTAVLFVPDVKSKP